MHQIKAMNVQSATVVFNLIVRALSQIQGNLVMQAYASVK